MKAKILNFLLIITSLLGYLEWGQGNHSFLFEAEAEILLAIFNNPGSVVHPFVVLPMAGQLILLFTLFQKKPSKTLTYLSIGGLGILLGFMFVIGLMALNMKIIASTVPFLIVAFLTIRYHRGMTV